jgi:hypothetical protein
MKFIIFGPKSIWQFTQKMIQQKAFTTQAYAKLKKSIKFSPIIT